ncbi:MAG: hypothetical protein WEB58_13125 [Planctomycetaceae bacterium]
MRYSAGRSRSPTINRRAALAALIAFVGLLADGASLARGQSPAPANCVRLEIYVKNDCKECEAVESELAKFAEKRAGVIVRTFNVDADPQHAERLEKIRDYFKVEKVTYPVVYGCNTFLQGFNARKTATAAVERMLTITAYLRAGCPHCAAAKRFLPGLMRRYPAFRLVQYDVVQDSRALDSMEAVVQRYRQSASSLPVIHLCNQLSIGYDTDRTTGRRIESIMKYWTSACPPREQNDGKSSGRMQKPFGHHAAGLDNPRGLSRQEAYVLSKGGRPSWASFPVVMLFFYSADGDVPDESKTDDESFDDPLPPPPLGDEEYAPLPPGVSDGAPPPLDHGIADDPTLNPESMEVPFFGTLSPRNLGMPAFTIMVGLVDGFNPCAMWVLLFLLSLLVNLKSRTKILAVAGTFVVISGVAYFAFMAAWLNVFLLIGYLRSAQIVLGALAILVGSVHVKDFFAFKKGISFSIPESAKPGIYARARKIVMAENIWGAITGAIVLAVLVNVIELLCTAGLPAMYTQILTMQNYPPWKNYAMLGLYNLAYMFDDSLMVGIVVVTLGKRRLQEKEGRWLKLLSGALILVLGVVMIFKPELLI